MRAYEFTNRQPVNEAFALTPFIVKWATGQALGWLKKQVAEKGRKTIADTQQLAAVDQSIAQALGQQDKEVGSILTAYVMHLIDKGDPVDAAIKTGIGIAREMVMQSDTVQGFKAQAFNTLRQLEPMADQWEALFTTRQQQPAPVQDLSQTQLEPIEPEDPLQPYINNDNQRDY
ncbi:MAG: hypothetical protein EBT86_12855 [Actinobacteria bacterium]|nr:hypothetical protein [Actinomycetota bacterium]